MEQPTASNRRQPIRQTRNNPVRNTSNATPAQGTAATPDNDHNANPGFFPALTHYTDAITALPKEMIRHETMLKEVDAKIYAPEAKLAEQINAVLKPPPSPSSRPANSYANTSVNANAAAPSESTHTTQQASLQSRNSPQPVTSNADDDTYPRRLQFHNIRSTLMEMLATLEEKNHVINTALDCLDKQRKRCNSSFAHIEQEISEEARLGSMTHWAYTDKTAEKKGIIAGERTRRAANNAAAIQEAEAAALRSETRREALAAKRPRNQHLDSDFDDSKVVGRKTNVGGKGRKAADTNLGNGVGLGIANTTIPPSKRRKIEKPSATSLGVERAMSSVYGSNATGGRGVVGSPRDLAVNDTVGKKRGRGGAVTNGSGRRRAGTNASAVNSPQMASSPVVGTFPTAKDRQGRSPAPSTMQRMPSSRARQNSTQNAIQMSRNRSTSTNHKGANGNGMYGTRADVDKVSGVTGKSTGDIKSSMKEIVNAKGEHLVEDIGSSDGAVDFRGGLVVGNRTSDRTLKREESVHVNGNGRTRPPSISVSTRGGNSKQPSKTATPINASFAESQRTRASREAPIKRSHKKGAGLAAQLAAAAAAQGDDNISMHGDEDEEDGDEPRYCYCNGVSYGQMVGCDGKECQREWFHLECVGLAEAPGKKGKSWMKSCYVKWYCDECKESLKDSKFNGSNAR